MAFFEKIDDIILKHCEKISHWFQELTGKTNFFIAKIGIIIATISTIISISNYFFEILPIRSTLFAVIFNLLLNLFFFNDAIALDEADKSSRISEERTAHPIIMRTSIGKRLLWVFVSFLSTFLVILTLKYISFLYILGTLSFPYGLSIFYYFIAVMPLKPRKSKVRKWIEKFSYGKLKPVSVT